MGWDLVVGFTFGVVIATVTAPVGVSGAVFLLPFNSACSTCRARRCRRRTCSTTSHSGSRRARPVPARRRAAVQSRKAAADRDDPWRGPGCGHPGLPVTRSGTLFRLFVALFLLPLGVWLLVGSRQARDRMIGFRPRPLVALGFGAGLIGGIYGIGGGSLLAPVLAASGYVMAAVAPAALLSTFVTSCLGALTYAVLDIIGQPGAAPNWTLGIACGLGGILGGCIGASLQPFVPQTRLASSLGRCSHLPSRAPTWSWSPAHKCRYGFGRPTLSSGDGCCEPPADRRAQRRRGAATSISQAPPLPDWSAGSNRDRLPRTAATRGPSARRGHVLGGPRVG